MVMVEHRLAGLQACWRDPRHMTGAREALGTDLGQWLLGKGGLTRGLHADGTDQASQEKSFEVVLVILDAGAVRFKEGRRRG